MNQMLLMGNVTTLWASWDWKALLTCRGWRALLTWNVKAIAMEVLNL